VSSVLTGSEVGITTPPSESQAQDLDLVITLSSHLPDNQVAEEEQHIRFGAPVVQIMLLCLHLFRVLGPNRKKQAAMCSDY
jgi:hypothetical protein